LLQRFSWSSTCGGFLECLKKCLTKPIMCFGWWHISTPLTMFRSSRCIFWTSKGCTSIITRNQIITLIYISLYDNHISIACINIYTNQKVFSKHMMRFNRVGVKIFGVAKLLLIRSSLFPIGIIRYIPLFSFCNSRLFEVFYFILFIYLFFLEPDFYIGLGLWWVFEWSCQTPAPCSFEQMNFNLPTLNTRTQFFL
jgi:hypothetical protein